jgi:hypothetical protein
VDDIQSCLEILLELGVRLLYTFTNMYLVSPVESEANRCCDIVHEKL